VTNFIWLTFFYFVLFITQSHSYTVLFDLSFVIHTTRMKCPLKDISSAYYLDIPVMYYVVQNGKRSLLTKE